jgi:7,8-dihydro-6-hydroxymethylpterin-pyrophosphokinase (HPPK)
MHAIRYSCSIHSSATRHLTLRYFIVRRLWTWKTCIRHCEAGASTFWCKSKTLGQPMRHRAIHIRRNGLPSQSQVAESQAYIALGSNVGDRIQNIESALQAMRQRGLRVKKVSNLYETKAMYYEDQGSFLNGACAVWKHCYQMFADLT